MFKTLKRTFAKKLSPEAQRLAMLADPTWSFGIRQYLSTPLPALTAAFNSLQFLALDFETTGVDPQEDRILSIGLVPMSLAQIEIAEAQEVFIAHGQYIKADSARVNQITPQMLDGGLPLEEGISLLFQALSGKVLLVHGACIERNFIDAYFKQYLGIEHCPLYIIDTLAIEKKLSYSGRTGAHKSFQLNDLRRHYGLPDYVSHSAASDAFACAELFMVQCKKLNIAATTSLRDLHL
ncbi:exonuclease domain-containing protein [Agarivorans sp. QJM3NY_29]|uniref:exonuclease domain-containing protein n=1 Tax=unclassified Agarivorans TaxID=2636026 RepID=UPI003D7C95B8